jgi:filamentous hemagglutinin
VVNIVTDNLLVESLQNTSSSNSKTQGANVGIGAGGISSVGANHQESESSSAWVDQQSGITGGTVNITAKDTTLKGGLIAALDQDGNDNGNLKLATDTLSVEDIQDHDTSSDKGFSLSHSFDGTDAHQENNPPKDSSDKMSTASTTMGANYAGHDTRQTTKATLGSGNVTVGGETIADGTVNRDVANAQEVTQDHELGGLDASVTVDHRLASEEGRKDIAENFEDTAEHAQDIGRTVSEIASSEVLNTLNFGETLHNNASITQLKNDLVRNPENSQILAGLNSENPEEYAQAVEDLGHLAQEKFGLELSDVDLYDAEKTTSGSLGDNALTDVKGGTVVDANNANAGDIFIDAGDGVSKTDMANTLGHEILEIQDFQGKDSSLTGGLFGKNTDQQQESLANAFGDQFADRINQAAGGDLDSTGGADFSNNLKNSEAVKAGTQKANTVGNARVEHRQLYVAEAKAIVDNAQTYADKHDISLDQAKQELTQQALLQVDSEWADQAHIQEKERAREGLLEIAALQDGKATDSYARDPINKLLRENESKYFQTDETAYNDTTANAHEASSIENGAAGEENFLVKYATENGEKPLEVGLADAAGQVVDNAEAFLDRATKDPLGLLKDTASGILDTVVDCSTTMNCVLPDQTHGTASDRELVYELLNNNDEAKQAAAEDTLDTLAGLAGPAGRVFKEGTGVVAGEAVKQAVKKTDVQAEIETLRNLGTNQREKVGLPADGGIPENGVIISKNNAKQLLESRGTPKEFALDQVESFDGVIIATQGKKGDSFVITEASPDSASATFVTRGSAGDTAAERVHNLALPDSNTAMYEGEVSLARDQVLLEGKVKGQPVNDIFGNSPTGSKPKGGHEQVVTDNGFRTGSVERTKESETIFNPSTSLSNIYGDKNERE